MVTKINNKNKFEEVLYKQGFDDLTIYSDGSWDKYGSGNGEITIERRHFNNLSKEDTKYIAKLVEIVLNTNLNSRDMTKFNYSSEKGLDSREDIQNIWEKNVKNA